MAAPNSSKSFGQWRILAICPSSAIRNALSPLLSDALPYSPITEVMDYPYGEALSEILEEHQPTVCFLDAATGWDRAQAILADFGARDTRLPIVAVLKENVPETILKALRSGATDFLVEPYTPEQVSAVMERVSGLFRAKGVSNARVVCVVPAKGACGASTVAGSLAFQMKRTGANKVLLADLDPITGTQSFLLKLKQSYSFMDAMTRDSHLDAELWKGIIHSVQGVDVILAPDTPVHGIDDLLDPGMLLEFARTLYDVIVVDAQSPYGEWGTSIVRHSDEVLLVTSNELPALQAAQRMLSFFDRHRIDRSKVRIVVNRYSRDVGLSKEVIEAALHCEVYHVIPSDYESVQRSLVEGKPLATSAGIGKSLLAMAERLSGKESRPDEPEPSSALNGLFSFFRR